MKESIRAFRLLTGEYVVSEILAKERELFILKDPYLMATHQTGPNQVQMQFTPWLAPVFRLYVGAICGDILEEDIPQHILDGYLQATSKIAIARATPKMVS